MATTYTTSLAGFKFPSGYTIRDIRNALMGGRRYVYFTFASGHAGRGVEIKTTKYGAILGRTLSGQHSDGLYPIVDARIENC